MKPIQLLRPLLLLVLLAPIPFAIAQMVHGHKGGPKAEKIELGTAAAVDANGQLWIATKETAGEGGIGYVTLQTSRDMGKTWSQAKRVQQTPEPISADGENRPKLAFGTTGEIYIAYTKPLTKLYTGEIRFSRSLDGGKTFSAPVTVHANRDEITHRFESMIVDKSGRIYIAWIDKRDAEAARAREEKYDGAAIYYAISENGGASFKGDFKVAEHSCECCRIGLALNAEGHPVAMWRHVFAPNVRDHALVELTADGKLSDPIRASFDDWRVDACPHHGPSLAYAADGTRYQTWFNVKGDEGGIFYATANPAGVLGTPVKLGNTQAEHADVAVDGKSVAVIWKQFDGKSTTIFGKISSDGGLTWQDKAFASSQGNSDEPHLFHTATGIALVWHTQIEGVRIIAIN